MYAKSIAMGVLGVVVLSAAAGAKTHAESAPLNAPLSVRYEWRNGTVAPPYHYEYTIVLGPGSRGRMVMHAGYAPQGRDTRPSWSASFPFTPAAREKLRATMRAHGVFTRSWSEQRQHPIGGGSENLEVKSGQRAFRIPSFVEGDVARADAQAVFGAINAIVPAASRARLEAQRQKHQARAVKATR